jgi:uncharacterized protein with NAD-binding domain and iron-sulfur cluster
MLGMESLHKRHAGPRGVKKPTVACVLHYPRTVGSWIFPGPRPIKSTKTKTHHMPDKEPIVILGGGMAALAAAYELSCTDELRSRYSVTVFQRGWRLGGKCASGRAAHPADPNSQRVEEHGLHVWFGFYFNAFHTLRACYEQLGAPYTIDAMFERRSSTPLMEPKNGSWLLWPLQFPEDPPGVEPGVNPSLPNLPQAVARLLRLIGQYLDQIAIWLPSTLDKDLQASVTWLEHTFGSPAWFTDGIGNVFGLNAVPHRSMLPLFAWTQNTIERWHGIRTAIDQVPTEKAALRDQLRRAWIIVDLGSAIARGLAAEAGEIALRGLGVLDNRDLREWLGQCGADPEAISSAPIRALYDLCFAYTDGDSSSFATADIGAGTALRCMLRIGMGYSGAVCYTMKFGMGEAVIAPIFKVLQRNGVRFEFFHRVDALELAGGNVAKVNFTRQAVVQGGGAYSPTVETPGGLAAWPSQPDFSQLVDGDTMKNTAGLDFESDLAPLWGGEQSETLDLTAPQWKGAKVVLAISIGALPRITRQLATPDSNWARMLDALKTVATQSAQLWMAKDFAGLGYPEQTRPAMDAGPEPMDVWSDMTPVIASEGWQESLKPASVQYVCGPLNGDFASSQAARQAVENNTAAWLDTMCKAAWPSTTANGTFDLSCLVASAGAQQGARLSEQYLRANFEGSERYVLSPKGSTAARLRADAMPAGNLYLAGDWTLNGLNVGCVEAAVMSGMQAARAIQGVPAYTMPGASD